jgi:hypothetical protein
MDRKMKARRANLEAKTRRERKSRSPQELCDDCGDSLADHPSYVAIPVLIDSETGAIEPIPDRSRMN